MSEELLLTVVYLVLLVVYLVLMTGLVACVWLFRCNDRTSEQREAIIYSLVGSSDFGAAFAAFEAVSYDRHLWSLFFLRDPMPLYGPLIREAMAGDAP